MNLRTAINYVILAQSAISTIPASAITGDIGIYPAGSSSLTGFSLTLDPSGVFGAVIYHGIIGW